MEDFDALISLREFCLRVSITRPTAYAWKHKLFGPTMVKVGSRQFYRRSEVISFIAGLSSGATKSYVPPTRAKRFASTARPAAA
jgi:predicted DNA-binding transcriptional regulator AlpA